LKEGAKDRQFQEELVEDGFPFLGGIIFLKGRKEESVRG
jgi:hypothetical protein